MTRCSTRPVLTMSTTIRRLAPIGTSSTWRTEDRVSDGYCMTATCWVRDASNLTVRSTTSSRSTAPWRKVEMAVRAGPLIGLSSLIWSTNTR